MSNKCCIIHCNIKWLLIIPFLPNSAPNLRNKIHNLNMRTYILNFHKCLTHVAYLWIANQSNSSAKCNLLVDTKLNEKQKFSCSDETNRNVTINSINLQKTMNPPEMQRNVFDATELSKNDFLVHRPLDAVSTWFHLRLNCFQECFQCN